MLLLTFVTKAQIIIEDLKAGLKGCRAERDAAIAGKSQLTAENDANISEIQRLKLQIRAAQEMASDSEILLTEYKQMHATQASHVSVSKSQAAAAQAELQALKVFSSEQSAFVRNLNEENTKLVDEIKRLKKQASVRDQQLQESVAMAKNAVLREKEKRAL